MTWTGQSFTAGQVLTASQMNNLQADITAQANGDTGAPKNQTASIATGAITEAKLAASAVAQGKLKSTTGEVSTSGASSLSTLPGGEYGFYPQVKVDSGTTSRADVASGVTSTSYATYIYLVRVSGSGSTYAQQRYIQSSPPYDMGDGEVPLFAFALIDNASGEIVGTYLATEAPWHYNGPTCIRADAYIDGVPHRWVRDVPSGIAALSSRAGIIRQKLRDGDAITDGERIALRDFFLAMQEQPLTLREITQAEKNADMNIVPHPFVGVRPDQTVALLDPLDPILVGLRDTVRDEGSNAEASKIIRRGFLVIDNTPLQRSGPPGVQQLGIRWRGA